jgi:excisionase family DNA binding protein
MVQHGVNVWCMADSVPLLRSIADVADMLSVSRWTVRRLIEDGMLETVKVRSRTMITTQSVNTYLERTQA